jgi:uncharacterized lipoprotein YddW (UPF0748 family)
MWVAVVANIDWPSAKGLSPIKQVEEMTRILDAAVRCKMNAVILQVRPSCDTMYPSELEPWSEFLTGRSGRGPQPEYDPLATWIHEAHARGLELHAWFNPFRARHFKAEFPDAPLHVSQSQANWVKRYDNLLWLNPAIPEAREHSLKVIMDVVTRYDIDGVHLDDYFYPYPKEGVAFPDETEFAHYRDAGGELERSDWRRDIINGFVRDLYESVKQAKPHVRVGISPFGIWRPGHPKGVEGFDAYEKLAADARLWLRSGWLDYCAPQLYWPIDAPKQSYEALLRWWLENNVQGRHLWIGNYTSRIEREGASKSWEPEEIVRQIEMTREVKQGRSSATGNIHFSAVAIVENRRGIADRLKETYTQTALTPACNWLAAGESPPGLPRVAAESADGSTVITAESVTGEPARNWVVWARYGETWRIAVTPNMEEPIRLKSDGSGGTLTQVGVAALDRFGRLGPAVTLERR